MQRVVICVVHERAEVVAEPEDLGRLHRLGIDAKDNRTAVGPIFGDRHPEIAPIVVEPARMVDGAFSQPEICDQIP